MHQKTDQLVNEIRQLPEEDRWKIFAQLMEDLHVEDEITDDAEWDAELERRMGDAHAGVPGIPADQVYAEIRKKLQRK